MPAMRPYLVRQGDYLTRIAASVGMAPDKLWNDPKNKHIRELRPNPEMLAPGDQLWVPAEDPRPRPTVNPGDHKRITVKSPQVTIELVLQDENGPLKDEEYFVEGLSSKDGKNKGKTGADGKVKLEVPVQLRSVRLVIPKRHTVYPILIGHLDPPTTRSGVKQRLEHLGCYRSVLSTDANVADCEAIKVFQRSQKLDDTGVADEKTVDALVRVHGS